MESQCILCDAWNQTPHAKRFTTPIPPQYAEETLLIGYCLGVTQNNGSICEKHRKTLGVLHEQIQKRNAPTIPPPPFPPQMPVVGARVETNISGKAAIDINSRYGKTADPTTPPIANLRKTFSTIAQSCAAEYIRQQPSAPPVTSKEMLSQVSPDVLRRALEDIAERCTDPDSAQFAARVLDGSALPSPAAQALQEIASVQSDARHFHDTTQAQSSTTKEQSTAGLIPCPLCHKEVKSGEVHSC